MLLQLPDGGQAVNRIPRKTADALGEDQVDAPGQRGLDHRVEAFPLGHAGAGDPFVTEYNIP